MNIDLVQVERRLVTKWGDIHEKKRQLYEFIENGTFVFLCFVFQVQNLGKKEGLKPHQTNIFLGMSSKLVSITFLDRRCKD